MAETWYFVTGTGASCGPGTQRPLSQTNGTTASTQDVSSEHTWNRTEASARSIAAGNWSLWLDVTTGAGGGPPNRVTAVVERRNSSCVVQQTIGSVENNMTTGATEEVQFDFGSIAQVDFDAGDILTVRIVRTNGSRTQVVRFDDDPATNADSRLIHPDEATPIAWEQLHFRFAEEDDTSAVGSPTWLEAEDTNTNKVDIADKFRLYLLFNKDAVASTDELLQLQFNVNSGGWNNVTSSSTGIRGAASAALTDEGSITSAILTAGTGTFVNGRISESDGDAGHTGGWNFTAAAEYSNACFVLEAVTGEISAGDVVQFRLLDGTEVFGTYTVTPQLTIPDTSYSTVGFRGREDDGSETAATWIAGQNVDFTMPVLTTFRLRFEMQEDGNLGEANEGFQLRRSVNSGAYSNVTGVSSGARAVSSSFLTDDEVTTNQLTVGTGTFDAGKVDTANGQTGTFSTTALGHTEVEFCIELVSVSVDDTVDFQLTSVSGAPITSTQIPTVTVVASGVNGSLNSTLGALTASASGEVDIDGTLNETLGALTLASSGSVDIDGTLSSTLGTLTASASGSVDIDGSLNETLGTLTLSASGTVINTPVEGTLNETLGSLTLASSGDVLVDGTLSATLGSATLSSTATVDIEGTFSNSLDALTLSSSGTVDIDGSLNETLGTLTLSASGTTGAVPVEGTLNETLGSLTLSSTGEVDIDGSFNNSLGDLTLSSSGSVDVVGTLNETLGDLTLSATGVLGGAPIEGTLNETLGILTLSSNGAIDIDGTLNETLGSLTLSSTGEVDIDGSLNETLGALTLSASGVIGDAPITGTLSQTLGSLTLSASGQVEISGQLASQLDNLTVSSTGNVDIGGTASISLGNLVSAASGTVDINGTVSVSLGSLTGSLLGEVEVQGTFSNTLSSLTLVAVGVEAAEIPFKRYQGSGRQFMRKSDL